MKVAGTVILEMGSMAGCSLTTGHGCLMGVAGFQDTPIKPLPRISYASPINFGRGVVGILGPIQVECVI